MGLAIRLLLFISLLATPPCRATTSEQALYAMRQSFLQAEQYIKQHRDDDYFAISDTLKNYPLYPYLHYQWLLQHLDDDTAISNFLHDYPHARYAALLHNKWLANLGNKQQWLTFIKHYKNNDSEELQCYFAQAQYHMGQQHFALEKAKERWSSGKPQAGACDILFDWLKASVEFNPELVWLRFEAALTQNHSDLAKQMLPLMQNDERKMAEIWLKLHTQPHLVKASAAWKRDYPKAGPLFAHAIRRWLNTAPHEALKAWDAEKNHFQIPSEIVADTEKRLALELAFERDKQAYARLAAVAGNDPTVQEWRVRAALSQQNWPDTLSALDALNDELRQSEKWQYWRARALASIGKIEDSSAILGRLAKQRSFYGFLSANQLQRDIELNHRTITALNQDIDTLQENIEFKAVRELLAIDRRNEAVRQWWHATADLDDQSLIVAAKLAQRWQWPSMAIFTIAKANAWDDMNLRFPLAFRSEIQNAANQLQLDPSLLFGLIRQESAFDEFAGSSAGAIGLMQVMPATAKQIANELNETWNNDFNLLLPEVNIKYGSTYFKKLLVRYSQHYALAIAAYNAGPHRVKNWLPKTDALPADIWIETIPYKETRSYVASVLMYALIYQKRLSIDGLKISDLLTEVKPQQK